MDKNNGGRAFPWCGDLNETPFIELGLTARDYFAAKAMQGLLAMPAEWRAYVRKDGDGSTWRDEAAEAAYQLADAMLRAREQ